MDNELLQAIGQMIDSKLAAERANFGQMIDSKLEPIREDIQSLKSGMADVGQRVTKIEVTQENVTNKRLDIIAEGVSGIQEKFEKLDRVEAQQEDHGHRIWALEQTVKELSQKAL